MERVAGVLALDHRRFQSRRRPEHTNCRDTTNDAEHGGEEKARIATN